jgi:peroxiredoxin-like protein
MHSYLFETETEWKGGREALTRGGEIPELQVSAPVEFLGKPGRWTPENLLVAATEVCVMETFLAICEWSHLTVASYRSTAQGKLEKVDGSLRFTGITIRPKIQVAREEQRIVAAQILEKAHKACAVSNSLRTTVTLEPVIEVLQPA